MMKTIKLQALNILAFFLFLVFLILIFFQAPMAKAVTVESGLFYFTNDLASTNSNKSTASVFDFAVLMQSDGRNPYGIGWSYIAASTKETTTTDTKYSSTETGPKFTYLFGKQRHWYLGLIYNLLAKSKFEDALGEAEWRGTSYRIEWGYLTEISNKLNLAVKLNYHKADFNEQITDSTTLTQTTNSKTLIYPTIALQWTF